MTCCNYHSCAVLSATPISQDNIITDDDEINIGVLLNVFGW